MNQSGNMKYKLIILLIPYFCLGFTQLRSLNLQEYSQSISPDTLLWDEGRKITWDDFQGMPDSPTIYGANTVSTFLTKSKYTSDTTISVIIYAIFCKKESWQKTQYQTEESLNHEQGHFDITEVYARKGTEAFKKYKYNKFTVKSDMNRIFDSVVDELNKAHVLYDKETSNHRNLKKQKEWDSIIRNWLEETLKYY